MPVPSRLTIASTILLLVALVAVPLAATDSNSSLAGQELLIYPGEVSVTVGEEFDVLFTVVLVHSTCPVDFDDNVVEYPSFLLEVSQTGWSKASSSSYTNTYTFRAQGTGVDYIAISRDCPRFGFLQSWILVSSVQEQVSTTSPPQTSTPSPPPSTPSPDMPAFDWQSMKFLTVGEVSSMYGVDVETFLDELGVSAEQTTTLYDVRHTYDVSKTIIQSVLESLYMSQQAPPATTAPPEQTPPPTFTPAPPQPPGSDGGSSGFSKTDMTLVTKDYVFIALIAISTALFALQRYKVRYLTLAISLLYFGFYLKGCMCHLGAIASLLVFDAIRLHWIVLVGVPVAVSLVAGRSFCGWVCMFGAFQDALYSARKKVVPIKTKRHIPDGLRYLKFVVLFAVLYFAQAQSRSLFCEYDPFFMPFTLTFSWGILGVLTILLIVASLCIERVFCRFICPLGAVFMVTDRIALLRVRIDRSSCTTCQLCSRVCPMKKDIVGDSGECISCGRCIEACRKGSIFYGLKKR